MHENSKKLSKLSRAQGGVLYTLTKHSLAYLVVLHISLIIDQVSTALDPEMI